MPDRPVLRFPIAGVLMLLEHTEGAKAQSPFFEDLLDRSLWKEGAVPDEDGMVKSEQLHIERIPASLAFVKDEGAFLMSYGAPPLLNDAGTNVVVYAEGYGPDSNYDALLDACGGDDFGERLLASDLRRLLAKTPRATHFCITVSETTFESWFE